MLSKLNRSRYTFKELQERPLPDGVDPLRLETYLGDEEFEVSDGDNYFCSILFDPLTVLYL